MGSEGHHHGAPRSGGVGVRALLGLLLLLLWFELKGSARTRLRLLRLLLTSHNAGLELLRRFVASLQRLSKEAAASGKEPPLAKGEAEYAARLGKLRIGETEVAKVVPDRIYSVAVLPSASSVVAAVGDRSGNLGIWNYSNQDSLEENGVLAFNPHTATINALAFDPTNPAKLFSTSYDGTIRCLDIETSRFDLVYASEVSF